MSNLKRSAASGMVRQDMHGDHCNLLTPITRKSVYNSNSADAESSDSSAGDRQACLTEQHTFDGLLEVGRLLLCGLPLQQRSRPFRLHLQHNAAATCHKAFIPILPDIHLITLLYVILTGRI